MPTEFFGINLSPDAKTALRKRAATITVETGKPVTMSDLVRGLVDQYIASLSNAPKDTASAIKFTPLPRVAKALKQAHFSSGRPVSDIVNEMLVEALQNEGISL